MADPRRTVQMVTSISMTGDFITPKDERILVQKNADA
ncbi:hypothetical protein AT05_11695 [Schleiferia thermophila str. Yellowstone]|nr:hypothetical protein AT05_11695 [Schleiferia thermophila str. Yellowstone]